MAHSELSNRSYNLSGGIVEIRTKVGEVIIITADGPSPASWIQISENPPENNDVKYHSSGKSQLGLPRMY
jgi:hypothetical protein